MNTEDLISSLSSNSTAIKVLQKPTKRILLYSAFGISWALGALWTLGLRNLETVHHPLYWLGEMVILAVLAITSISCAVRLSLPGEEIALPWRPVVASMSLWFLYLCLGTLFLQDEYGTAALSPINGASCALTVVTLCTIPVYIMVRAVRSGFPTCKRWASFSAVAAGSVLSVLGIEVHCVFENTAHHIVYHFGPVVILSSIAFVTSRALLD